MADGSTVAATADVVHARLREAAGQRWRAARLAARRRHAPERALPGMLVLGAQRGGTTSLYRHLANHPQVHRPLDKEIQFFSVAWGQGIDWYRCHFGPAGDGRLNFEASPYYLYHPCAPVRVASVVPKAKLIALLRDPASRAWSHYHHNLRLGLESLSFADAIAAEPERLAGEAERLRADPTAVSFAHRHHSYLDRSRYGPQVARWREVAGDRLLVLRSEQLFDEPHRTFQRLLEFLELDPWRPAAYGSGAGRTAPTPPMPERLRAELRGRFHGSADLLRPYVDFDPTMWAA
jgi:hypothetical protein